MRLLPFAFLLIFATSFTTLVLEPADAQEAELLAGEDEPPALSPAAVQGALLALLESAEGDPTLASTTADPDIDLGALDILLKPMTLATLRHEIAGWDLLLQEAVLELAIGEMELFELNAAEADARDAAEDGTEPTTESSTAPSEPGQITPEHQALIDANGALRAVRTERADRLRLVLDAFEAKGGDPAELADIRTYLADVSGVEVDVTNLQTALLTLEQWARAEDGGLRLLRHGATLVGATLTGLALGWVLSLIVSTGLRRTELTSQLLVRFLRVWLGRIGGLVGLLLGLSWIGTNMTPILATLGAAGFILAFALQNTISNFASGLLILFQRPFDAGDEIEAAGITGEVERVSLFSTHLSTDENRKVIVPNNMIWEDVIVNSTGAPTRRLQIEIEINAADHSLEEAEEILMRVMDTHQDVLQSPAPDLKLSAMTAESHTFICWPWVETPKKDTVRWDLVSKFGRELNLVKGLTKSSAA